MSFIDVLWIPYKLYLWSIENSHEFLILNNQTVVNSLQIVSLKYWKQSFITNFEFDNVVNSLQIVSLKYWKQWTSQPNALNYSCEFLTNCIFEVLKTVLLFFLMQMLLLWIPYKLYLWSIENSHRRSVQIVCAVVNSLQIVSLKYWKQ